MNRGIKQYHILIYDIFIQVVFKYYMICFG